MNHLVEILQMKYILFFYLELGDSKRAVANYGLERRNWPESQTLMDALIKTLEARTGQADAAGAAK